MREIKFRLWNQKALCMENAGDRPFTISPWGVPLYDGFMLTNRVVMQYTGLKDKNGKEIYEGDIIRSYNIFGDSFAVLSVVAWDENKTGYTGIITHELHLEEVIGNIHSNPELLKEAM